MKSFLLVLLLGALSLAPNSTNAQTCADTASLADSIPGGARVPFRVGEELVYRISLGPMRVGSGRMHVQGIDTVRGQPAYHLVFSLDGGIPGFRIADRYESWMDVRTLSSLRYHQQISEGRYHRVRRFEIYPERATYQREGDSVHASVPDPLDDGSFTYAVRTIGMSVGEVKRLDRYFQPERNPVLLNGLRTDTAHVGAGTFPVIVVRPLIRTNGVYENGDAEIWFSADSLRLPVLIKSRFFRLSLTFELHRYTVGGSAPNSIAAAENPCKQSQ